MIRRHWTLILLILAPVLPLWRPLFLGETIGPVEQIVHMAPWNGPPPEQPWDVVQADAVLQFLPWRDLVFRAWHGGELPAWNRFELAGTPLLANSQSGALYPPHILAGLLRDSEPTTPKLMALLAWLHLALTGLGTSLLCRRLGGSQLGGLLAGLSFVFSAFVLSWTSLPSVLETLTWIPWALVACTALVEDAPLRKRLLSGIGLAWAMAMMVLAGHLQFMAYGVLTIVIFAAGRALVHCSRPSWRSSGVSLALVLGSLVLGFGLAAPQLLPVLQFSKQSHRQNAPSEQGYEDYSRSAIRLWELGGAVYPKLEGDPTAFTEVGDQKLSAFWPQYVRPGANFAESAVGLGPLIVCLLMCGRRNAPYWRNLSPLIFCGVLGLLLAIGSALGRLLYFGVPGWSATGSPGRAAVIFVLAGCVAAGVVASQPMHDREQRRRRYAPVAGFLLLTVACVYLVRFGLTGLQPALPNFSAENLTEIISESTRMGILEVFGAAVLTVGAVGLWLRSGRARPAWLLVPLFATPFLVVPPLIRSGQADLRSKEVPQGRIAIINDRWNLFSTPRAVSPPNLVSLGGVLELGGYDSLLDLDTKALLDGIDGHGLPAMQGSTPNENGNMLFVTPTADAQKLADAGVTEVWSSRPDLPFGPCRAGAWDDFFRYSLTGPGRVSVDGRAVPISSESFSDLKLRATGPGRLVVRDRKMPGWSATVDGKLVPLEGTLWRELDLPPGEHQVRISYTPPGFIPGLWLAGVAAVVLGAYAIGARTLGGGAKEPPQV